ncbi:MAG: translation initiation factor IF-3 [Victivallaceae bacterium]
MAKLLKTGDRSFTADRVRLVGANGEQLGIVPLSRARIQAETENLDLVIVSEKAVPPVVRIMDFGKLQYEQKKNLKAQRKNSLAQKLKEVKFHMNIDDHDYDYKLKHAVDFLQKGCKLKVTLTLRGREMAHKELADQLMDRIIAELAPNAEADGRPKMFGRNISVTFTALKSARKASVKPQDDTEEFDEEEIGGGEVDEAVEEQVELAEDAGDPEE